MDITKLEFFGKPIKKWTRKETEYALTQIELEAEQILENNLIAQLQKLGYKSVVIKDETDLLANFKKQLEIHNFVKATVDVAPSITEGVAPSDTLGKGCVKLTSLYIQ